MKVRMKIKIQGTRDGVAWPEVGEVKELPDHEAARLCDNGFATPVVEDRTEKAVADKPVEKRGGRGRAKSV